jgi:hypothetical protein
VGKFQPEANTEAVKPAGRSIFGGKLELKNAVLSGQIGFDAAWAIAGKDRNVAIATVVLRVADRILRMAQILPPCSPNICLLEHIVFRFV